MHVRVLAAALCLSPLFAFGQSSPPSAAQPAATPPMGWNSWNYFAGRVTDADVRAAADALVSSGMRDAGYIYVNIDDTWEGERDAQGVIHTNSKFPDMKALADYVHSKGLKIGIYSSPGPKTCGGYAGSYGHEAQDAKTYTSWGFDYLKYDLCSYRDIMKRDAGSDQAKANQMMQQAYMKMHDALQATGRPMLFSLCQYGFGSVWKWGPQVGASLWRTTGDMSDNYDRMSIIGFGQAGLAKYAGPSRWNDPDILEVGNGKMTVDEERTHMSLWAMLAAPLLAGNDLSKMIPETRAILMNKDVIAIDQDALGKEGDRVTATGPFEVWAKPLRDGSQAIALFNRGEDAETMELPYAAVSVARGDKARDVWGQRDFVLGDSYSAMVPSHGVMLLRIGSKR